MKVLIIDSNKTELTSIKQLIEGLDIDWDVETASCGDNAITILDKENIQAVITTVHMPVETGDGIKVLNHMKKLDKKIPAYVYSENNVYDVKHRGRMPITEILKINFSFAGFYFKKRNSTEIKNFLNGVPRT